MEESQLGTVPDSISANPAHVRRVLPPLFCSLSYPFLYFILFACPVTGNHLHHHPRSIRAPVLHLQFVHLISPPSACAFTALISQ
jgi:hypothetical protein